MAEEHDPITAEVTNVLEAEPSCMPTATRPPSSPHHLAILVSTGKAKEAAADTGGCEAIEQE